MNKLWIGVAACALIITTSCTENVLIDGPQAGNKDGKIMFTAAKTLNATKGTVLNSTADLQKMGKFKVAGYVGSDNYLSGVDVSWSSITGSWEYSNEVFWPSSKMNFYAYAPFDQANTTIASTGITVTGYTVPTTNADQKDLIFATAIDKEKEDRTLLLFRHALTQIVFKAMVVDGSNLDVEISDVEICNIQSKSSKFVTINDEFKQNTWTLPADADKVKTNFNANPTAAVKFGPSAGGADNIANGIGSKGTIENAKRIITAPVTTDNVLLMIPQNFKAWDTKVSIKENDKQNGSGNAYIKLIAKVKTTRNAKEYYLHGSETAGAPIYIPVASLGTISSLDQDVGNKSDAPLGQWVPGRRINYIITFGDTDGGSGGGGFTEDPTNPDDPNLPPVQVLVPIKFTAEMEEWVDNDVPLLTATFEGTSDKVDETFINQFTNQLIADLESAIVPKKYNANIKIGGTLNTAVDALSLDGYLEDGTTTPEGYGFRYLPGTTVTYDFSGLTFDSKTIKVTAPEGWIAQAYKGETAVGTPVFSEITIEGINNNKIVLIRKAWTIAQIKASAEKRATSAVYNASDDATALDWTPLYLTPFQTLTIQFPNTMTAPTIDTNWSWDGTSYCATYTQPYHAATINKLGTLLNGAVIKGYSYYINQDGGDQDLPKITTMTGLSVGESVYVVFKTALTDVGSNTGWTKHATNSKIAIYTVPAAP